LSRSNQWSLHSLSIIVPVFNEGDNLQALVRTTLEAARGVGLPFELIVVDDGSSDDTEAQLAELSSREPELIALILRRNFGQTLALRAGLERSRGDAVVTMDGDLQNDPRDIPHMLAGLRDGADVVSGWRRQRQDTLVRRIPSLLANQLVRLVTGARIHDQGCALKAYRGELIRSLDLYADQHRFIATLTLPLGARISEIEVRHHPRRAGESKYGASRFFRVVGDLLTLQMLTRFRDRPLHWFGVLGSPFLLAGVVASLLPVLTGTGNVVWSAVAFLTLSTFGSCLLLGLLGEATIEVAGRGRSRPVLSRERSSR
jgi:glycosyltransferase involved in cell wall biosynthesis